MTHFESRKSYRGITGRNFCTLGISSKSVQMYYYTFGKWFKLEHNISLNGCILQTLMCVKIHQMVAKKCEQYLAELSRHNYVTPKSYLELLKIFSDLIGCKKQELCGARQRMKTGLDKARPCNRKPVTQIFVLCLISTHTCCSLVL